MDIVVKIGSIFQEELKDGFQPADITETLERTARLVVREVAEGMPGATGQEKMDYAIGQVLKGWRSLLGTARELLVVAIGGWMGYAFDLVRGWLEQAGERLIEETLTKWIKSLLEWAYADTVSAPLLQAFAG